MVNYQKALPKGMDKGKGGLRGDSENGKLQKPSPQAFQKGNPLSVHVGHPVHVWAENVDFTEL